MGNNDLDTVRTLPLSGSRLDRFFSRHARRLARTPMFTLATLRRQALRLSTARLCLLGLLLLAGGYVAGCAGDGTGFPEGASGTPPGSYTVTVTPSGGFNGVVIFGVSGLPNNSTATFSPPSVTGSGSSTMTVATKKNTQKGTFTLTISGTSGALTRTTTVTLIVTK